MAERDKNAAIADEIYSQSPYSWDGKSRPNINDYISPWARYANLTESGATAWKKNRHYNAAIRYAKTMLESAISQYDNDVSFWNERDERFYTTPSAQSQRFEDAGYNLGYMYGSVDSGNSAVGYGQNDSSYTPNDTSSKSNERAKVVIEAVGTAFSIATNLIRSGISLKKLPAELDLMGSQSAAASGSAHLSESQADLNELSHKMQSYLQSHDKDGNKVTSLGDSLAFSIEAIRQKMMENQSNLAEQQTIERRIFNQFADQLYELQSTPTASQSFNSWVNSLDIPDWCKVTFIVLGAAVGATFDGGIQGLKKQKTLRLPNRR